MQHPQPEPDQLPVRKPHVQPPNNGHCIVRQPPLPVQAPMPQPRKPPEPPRRPRQPPRRQLSAQPQRQLPRHVPE